MNQYIKALKKSFVTNGRASRSEYWYFVLFQILIVIGLSSILNSLGLQDSDSLSSVIYGLLGLYMFFTFLITQTTLLIRRMHDIGKSGWWFLITFIPLIGGIWMLVLLATDSQKGTNKYGPNPKGIN